MFGERRFKPEQLVISTQTFRILCIFGYFVLNFVFNNDEPQATKYLKHLEK